MNIRRTSIIGSLLLLVGLCGVSQSNAEEDPFPGVASYGEIPGTRISSTPGQSQSQWEATDEYKARAGCSPGSGNALEANATTHIYSIYCVKTWRPSVDINADANFRAAQDTAIAAATLESQAWNAANPGKQKCIQWGPIVHANGVSTASGGVCANPVAPGPGTTVPTAEATAVEAKTTTLPTAATPVATPTQPDANPTLAILGNGKPFTRVLPGQLSTDQCPVGFQAANGVIVAIGTGTFTECWPENAWNAWRLGGTTWEDFKNSGGTTNVQAVIDLNAAIATLKSEAKTVAQNAADSTPGIQRCSKWSGYGQSGQECAYTFLAPGEKPLVSESSETPTKPKVDTPPSGTSTLPATDTATVTSSTETPQVATPVTSTNTGTVKSTTAGESNSGLTAISVEGTTQQLSTLIAKVVDTGLEQKSLAKILVKLDALRPITYSKTQSLPIERVIEETAVSLTPDVCSVKGTTVTSLKPGKCVFTYELVGNSGNSFMTQKSIIFKK